LLSNIQVIGKSGSSLTLFIKLIGTFWLVSILWHVGNSTLLKNENNGIFVIVIIEIIIDWLFDIRGCNQKKKSIFSFFTATEAELKKHFISSFEKVVPNLSRKKRMLFNYYTHAQHNTTIINILFIFVSLFQLFSFYCYRSETKTFFLHHWRFKIPHYLSNL
jgi:hypothetical protein